MDIIDAHIYNPSTSLFKAKKSDPAEFWLYMCANKEACDLYKINRCIQKKFMGFNCPYGKINYEKGPTRRARAFSSWITDRKIKYKDTLDLLTGPENVLAKVGDYFYLPYAHMFFNSNLPVLGKDTILSSGKPFIHEKDFTVDLIMQLIRHRPQAMFGGEIRSYQEKELPLFLKHLSEQQPEVFKQVSTNVDLKNYLATFTNIGRKVLLSSLRAGVYIKPDKDKKEVWLWDGVYLISDTAYLAFTPVKFIEHSIKIKPIDGAVVKISDENQVDTNTIFIS